MKRAFLLLMLLAACGRTETESPCSDEVLDAGDVADAGPSLDAGEACIRDRKLELECASAYANLVRCCPSSGQLGAESACELAADGGVACEILSVSSCSELADGGWCR